MIKVLAFDVSETLQTGSEHDDNGLGQPMIDFDGEIIEGAYSVLIGGIRTAQLLQDAQRRGIEIVLVTNNGDDLDKAIIERTLNFLKKYGINLKPEHYMGPVAGQGGSKVPRLEQILIDFNINKDELMFFDDSRNNVSEAQAAGFQAIRVMTADHLQQGIEAALTAPQVEQIASSAPVTPVHETLGAASSSSSSQPSASPAQQTPFEQVSYQGFFGSSSDKSRQKTVEEELLEFMTEQVKQMGFDSVEAAGEACGPDMINDIKAQFPNMRSEQGPRG